MGNMHMQRILSFCSDIHSIKRDGIKDVAKKFPFVNSVIQKHNRSSHLSDSQFNGKISLKKHLSHALL